MNATTKAIICEVCNLLTEENLASALKQTRMSVDLDVYRAMQLRYATLRLRLALPLHDGQQQEIDKAEAVFDRVLAHAKLDGSAAATEIINLPIAGSVEEREVRYNALTDRLYDALRDTKHGSKLEKEAEREYRETKRSAYAELTGDRDLLWYRG
jgi:hypothetical protein